MKRILLRHQLINGKLQFLSADSLINDSLRFVNNVTQSIDGNFSLHLKQRQTDPDDTELITGAYFPSNASYMEHLRVASDTTKVCPPCHFSSSHE